MSEQQYYNFMAAIGDQISDPLNRSLHQFLRHIVAVTEIFLSSV